jgi:hypothetical protein
MAKKEKKETKRISIVLSKEMEKKIETGKYSRNKLIISLLEKFLLKK